MVSAGFQHRQPSTLSQQVFCKDLHPWQHSELMINAFEGTLPTDLAFTSSKGSIFKDPSDYFIIVQSKYCHMSRIRPPILLFGDSLTEQSFRPCGWGSLLYDAYMRRADVICRGFSGYTTRLALPVLESILQEEISPFLIAFVWFGANDASNGCQNVPVDEFERNLISMFEKLKDVTSHIVCLSPPPVDSSNWSDRSNESVKEYVAAGARAAAACKVQYIDVFTAFVEQAEWADLMSDGLHLSEKGNHHVFELIMSHLSTFCLEAHPDALPTDFPGWREALSRTQLPIMSTAKRVSIKSESARATV